MLRLTSGTFPSVWTAALRFNYVNQSVTKMEPQQMHPSVLPALLRQAVVTRHGAKPGAQLAYMPSYTR